MAREDVERRAMSRLNDAGVHIEAALSLLYDAEREVRMSPGNNRLVALTQQLDIIGMAVDGLRRQVSESLERRSGGDGA